MVRRACLKNRNLKPVELNFRAALDVTDVVNGVRPFILLINEHDLEREPVQLPRYLKAQLHDRRAVLATGDGDHDIIKFIEYPFDSLKRGLVYIVL